MFQDAREQRLRCFPDPPRRRRERLVLLEDGLVRGAVAGLGAGDAVLDDLHHGRDTLLVLENNMNINFRTHFKVDRLACESLTLAFSRTFKILPSAGKDG